MTHSQPNAEDIAVGNWEHILVAAGMDPSYLRYEEGPCPICGGNTRFRWRAKKESAFCNHCRFLSGFALLQHLLSTDFKGAADFIRKWAGVGGDKDGVGAIPRRPVTPAPRPVEEDDTEALRQKYRKLWREGIEVKEGDAAYRYLMRRVPGLDTIPAVFRFHSGLGYWKYDGKNFQKLGEFPALLAAAQGLDGRVANVWRIYLTSDGAKADVPDAKKAAGRFLQPSFAVRLVEPQDELAVAEGIETALAVWKLYGIPCWATLNADGMRKFELPAGYERVKKIRIFADNDTRDKHGRRAGNDAAHALRDRLKASGLTATILMPKFTDFDFGDIVEKTAAN